MQKQAGEGAAARSGGGIGRALVIGTVAIVLLAGAVFAGSMLGPRLSATPGADAPEARRDDRPALYASLQPPLVVNFRDSTGDSHYMQVTLDLMTRDPAVLEAIKQHSPAIRNGLILLFSDSVDYAAVNTREYKEKLLADALVEVQKVLRERTGREGVESVYFTSLIVQ
jgi:flagellar FliL protein